LQQNEGIIVKSVMPNGPAEKAGIQAHDIITRIGDESLSSPEDLRRIVRKHKPGDTIELGLIRIGRSAAIKVTLSERPDNNMANNQPRPLQNLNLDGVPDEMAQRMRDMIQGNVREFQWPRGGNRDPFGGINQDFEESFRRMHEQMEQLQRLQLNPPADGEGINMQQSMTIRMLDDNGSIELSANNGKRNLTVRDQDNKTLWTGPWNTDEDKAAAPEDIRRRVEKLNIENSIDGSSLRFRFGTDN
jgi:membrane-associated protease RseP (regulator of RpoE activity)